MQSTIRKGIDNMPKTLRETLSAIYDDYKKHNLNRVKLRVVSESYKSIAMLLITNFSKDVLDDWAMNRFVSYHTYTGEYELIVLSGE